MMHLTTSAFLTLVIFTILSLQTVSAETDSGKQSAAPVEATIDTLPPTGKGQGMVKPYQPTVPEPVWVGPDDRGGTSRNIGSKPLSQEIVTPGYPYGRTGYMPDGRGGRGYDFGYPGYRDTGGGGYPHGRDFGGRRFK